MKRKLCIWALCLPLAAMAQMPAHNELTDTKPCDRADVWQQKVKAPTLLWGSTDVRYAKRTVPSGLSAKRLTLKAWRGERVNAQAVLYTAQALTGVTLSAGELRNGQSVIPASAVRPSFVRYVITDEANKDGKTACGHRPDKSKWDSSLVADALDPVARLDIEACTARPVWINVAVPQDARPGTYRGTLSAQLGTGTTLSLPYEIQVSARTLPAPHAWQFHLDLWQNPYSVARFYNVPLWSKEHFDHMRPLMKALADAGQKVITTSIMHHPWNGQTEDAFKSMVVRTRRIDGTWQFDYTVFDRWVEFMMSVGIDKQINCYTMIPWAMNFDYFDQATASVKFIHASPGQPAYTDYWMPFLKDFAAHLRKKGWFGITHIAIDERSMPHMREAFKLVKQADPSYKISSQVKYYPEVEPLINDLCLAYGDTLPADVWQRRRSEGKLTTYYTCCSEAYPNTFTFSAPAEAAWLPWHAMAEGFGGYLRWAYNSWTAEPLTDTRFRTWAAGDCFIVYPGASSIRMERLIEGIQDAEKIRLLREEFTAKGNTKQLDKLNSLVKEFVPENLTRENATQMVNRARKVLETF